MEKNNVFDILNIGYIIVELCRCELMLLSDIKYLTIEPDWPFPVGSLV